jgi:CubicO group peptidase (beta-lactamase class C family)
VLLALAGSVVISVYHFVAPEALSANDSGSQASSSASGPEDAQEVEEFFDDLIGEQLRDEHVAGATVAVVKDGQLVFAKGYGYADWEQGTPVTADRTLFYPGSAGKLFTWTAVMQLVEEGKLDLDADINTHLDFEIPNTHPEPVTMGDLLTHTAGFEEQFAAQLAEDREDVLPLREFLVRYMPERVYPPGEYFAYSNYGTALAGYIVERVSGEPYEQYIEEHILQPLRMESSAAIQPLPADLTSQLSKGYHYEDGTYEAKDFEWISAAPAAPVRATATDMAKFMLAHLGNGQYGDARILEDDTALEMHRQQFTHDPRLSGVTYGFITSRENDQDIIWHNGESARFSTMVALLPKERAGLFVSYNTPFEPRETLSAFLDHYYPPQEETSLPEPPSDFASRADRWAGTYIPMRVAHTGPQKIVGWLDPLKVSADNQTLLLRTPLGEQRYAEIEPGLLKEEDGERLLTFREDDQGQATHLFWGPLAYSKAAPYQTLGFQLSLLVACMTLFVSTLIVFPAAFFVCRWRGGGSTPPRTARVARWLAGITGGLNLIVLVWFVISLLEFAETYVWPTETVSTITGLWLLSVPLTLSIVVLAVLAWKDRYWSVASRAHYTLVALAAVLFDLLLSNWNLIGL